MVWSAVYSTSFWSLEIAAFELGRSKYYEALSCFLRRCRDLRWRAFSESLLPSFFVDLSVRHSRIFKIGIAKIGAIALRTRQASIGQVSATQIGIGEVSFD